MDSMSKPLHAGRAAEAGVTAALAAAEGVTGSLDILEGDSGLGRAMSDGPDWQKAVATLGQDFHITRITFKNHACCGHTFAPIDGALALQAQHAVRPEDIERIDISTYSAALDVAGYEHPETPAEARFSVKYTVASALVHGSVRLAAFGPARMADPATRALMQRITLAVDPALDAAFPGRRAAQLRMQLRDGRVLTHMQPTRKGDPEQPLTDSELEQKYLELAVPVLGQAAAAALLDRLQRIGTLGQL
jgi:2-methylcitrate dehydratase PrpD